MFMNILQNAIEILKTIRFFRRTTGRSDQTYLISVESEPQRGNNTSRSVKVITDNRTRSKRFVKNFQKSLEVGEGSEFQVQVNSIECFENIVFS